MGDSGNEDERKICHYYGMVYRILPNVDNELFLMMKQLWQMMNSELLSKQ